MTAAKGSTSTASKATDDKVAATGGSPTSDKKAADTAQEYEQLTGQADQPASDSDPVMDSINEAIKDIEQPEPQTALINPLYEQQRAEAFEAREADEPEDVDPENVPDADHTEVGTHVVEAEEAKK
jgi:uncharacterized phage infection (PIP) family protein YhgE